MKKNSVIIKKTVLFILDIPDFSGLTQCNINIAEALRSNYKIVLLQGFRVESQKLEIEKNWKHAGASIFYFKEFRFRSRILTLVINIIRSFFILRRIFKVVKPDIVISNFPSSTIAAAVLKPGFHFVLITLFHGVWKDEILSTLEFTAFPVSRLDKLKIQISANIHHWIQTIGFWLTDVSLVHSTYSKEVFQRAFKRNPVMYKPPIDKLPFVQPVARDPVVVAVSSRLEPRKGIQILIQAAANVLQSSSHFYFRIFGKAYDIHLFYRLFSLFPHSNIAWHGNIHHHALLEAYKGIDVLVMPSVFGETFGFSTLEALAMGIPVIGSDSGATPELLTKINKRLVFKNRSPADLAKALYWFLSLDLKQRRELSLRCRRFATHNHGREQFLSFFNELLNQV